MKIIDVEIKKGILGRKEVPMEGIEYCGGWRDSAGRFAGHPGNLTQVLANPID